MSAPDPVVVWVRPRARPWRWGSLGALAVVAAVAPFVWRDYIPHDRGDVHPQFKAALYHDENGGADRVEWEWSVSPDDWRVHIGRGAAFNSEPTLLPGAVLARVNQILDLTLTVEGLCVHQRWELTRSYERAADHWLVYEGRCAAPPGLDTHKPTSL